MTQKRIAWITDSTAFLTDELTNHEHLYVIPLGITIEDKVYEDGVDLTTDTLYKHIRNEKEVPKTSQPPVGKFVELFETLKKKYDGAIAVHISSKLSGTLATCKTGAEMAGFDVDVIDSRAMSYAITSLIEKGLAMEKEGLDQKTIASKLHEEALKNENYILLGNLDQFYKGGRMSGTQFLLGNLLSIKPIIRIYNGAFELFEKVRSEKRATKKLFDLFDESYQKHYISQIQIMHGNVMEKAREYANEFRKKYPNLDIVIGELSSTIAVHAGEGTIALIWHKESKK
ncbi:DegV family protein [Peribacillus tepidiphilus]|uniref:DegV family protein n=1 Tax=Peribacillus tepidiphilus TaxID=2652445 RepID=UPI0035B5677D